MDVKRCYNCSEPIYRCKCFTRGNTLALIYALALIAFVALAVLQWT